MPNRLLAKSYFSRRSVNSTRGSSTLASAALILGLIAQGCGGAAGDPCQIATDCETNLMCCNGGAPGQRGVCGATCTGVVLDSGTPTDAGGNDGGIEDTIEADVPAEDVITEDVVTVDGGAEDTGSDAAGAGCTTNGDCTAVTYCEKAGCDGDGVCAFRPADCPGVINNVCACDGSSYLNACEAASAGQNVASEGLCGATDGGKATDAGPAPGPDAG